MEVDVPDHVILNGDSWTNKLAWEVGPLSGAAATFHNKFMTSYVERTQQG